MMRNVMAIALREFKAFYVSPIGYVVMACWLAFAGFIFYLVVSSPQAVATMDPIFRNCTILLVMMLPLLTMRLLAGERSGDQGPGTIELLLTSPVSEWELVLGKYLATLFYLATLVLASLIYPFALMRIGKPDVGPILSGYIGFFLFSGYILAFGLLMSAITNSQIVAAVTTIVGALLLWLVNYVDAMGAGASPLATFAAWFSMLKHHEDFWRGVVTLADVAWYLSFIFFFLFAAKQAIASTRWR